MKIKLLTYLQNPDQTYLNSSVLLKTPHGNPVKTIFILDTGSPTTIIGYADARRLQIPFDGEATNIRLGGRNYWGYNFNRLKMIFKSEDGQIIEEEMKVIVLQPTSTRNPNEVYSTPTIIGTDFLKEKGYKLFCDMANNEAYIEK